MKTSESFNKSQLKLFFLLLLIVAVVNFLYHSMYKTEATSKLPSQMEQMGRAAGY